MANSAHDYGWCAQYAGLDTGEHTFAVLEHCVSNAIYCEQWHTR